MEVGVLTMEDYELKPVNSVGSSRIRARWPLRYWDEAEPFQYGHKYDCVIYQKAYFLRHMKRFDGIKIFDICDKDWPERPVVETFSLCDAVVTSTQALAEEIKKFTDKPVKCIPDRVDLNEVKRLKKTHKEKLTNALWYGYFHNFDTVKPALPDLSQKGINLTIISDKHPVHIRGYGIEVESKKYKQDTIYEELSKADVVLNPKLTYGKWKLKSDNKTVIAQAVGVPVATTLDDLNRLQSKTERIKESNVRTKEVKQRHDVRISVQEYKKLIKGVENERKD